MEEGHGKAVPSPRVGLPAQPEHPVLLGDWWSSQRLHSPEVPGGSVQGALKAASSFSVHIQLTVEGTRYWDSVSLFA